MEKLIDRLSAVVAEAFSAAGYDPSAQSLDEYLRICEEQILRRCMAENEGNISAAARQLGIKRQTLQHKLKKYKI